MAYIGRGLDRGNYLKLDDISSQFDGSKTTFDLTNGGQPFFPGSAFSLLVSISGVIQEPETAYQIDSSQIVFTGPPGNGEVFFAIAMSQPISINTPADGTVSTVKIANSAVTQEKLAASARGVGIQSAGTIIGAGITQLNFVGAGNTFLLNGTTVDVSIAGGGGGGGGSITGIITAAAGIGTEVLVGINTVPVGLARSEGVLQVDGSIAVADGAVLTDQNIDRDVIIPPGKNGLLIGTATVGVGVTVEISSGSTLVIV